MGSEGATEIVVGSAIPSRSPLRLTLEMIKFSHSVFALPFALLSTFLAARGAPPARTLLWIVVAMVGARSMAMVHNRIADRHLDAENPRTKDRHLVTGALSVRFAWAFLAASAAVFVLAAWELNPLAFRLSPVAVALLLAYAYTKRFTWLSHLILGLCLGMAPLGAWIAVEGRFDLLPILLGLAVAFWTAGFDVIYSLQDEAFDRSRGLHSLPARLGPRGALRVCWLLHALTLLLLAAVWRLAGAGWLFAAGVGATAAALAWQHRAVRPGDLSRVNAVFFTANGFISLILAASGILDQLLLK